MDLEVKNTSEYKETHLEGIYGIFVPYLIVALVAAVLGFSALFTLIIDFPKCYLFRKFGL